MTNVYEITLLINWMTAELVTLFIQIQFLSKYCFDAINIDFFVATLVQFKLNDIQGHYLFNGINTFSRV